MYTVGRALSHAKLTAASNGYSRFLDDVAKICVQDSLVEFFSREWPFLHGEGVVTTTAPYITGTINTSAGSPNIVGVGTTWDTTWPVPAILRSNNGRGEEFLVTSFNSTTGITIDTDWPYDTETGIDYTIEFPAYDIPNYLFIDSVMTAYAFKRFVAGNSYRELMAFRHGWLFSGYPAWYTIVPGDAFKSTKIWVSPSPNDVYTFRYTYRAAVPEMTIHNYGTASVTNADATVTGSSGIGINATNWNATGFTMAGKIFEVTDPSNPQNYSGTVLSITNAAELELTANWSGRSANTVQYAISNQLNFPDDCIPCFRALVESYVFARINPDRAPQARAIYNAQLIDACQRYERDVANMYPRGVNGWTPPNSAECGPGMPTELIVRTI